MLELEEKVATDDKKRSSDSHQPVVLENGNENGNKNGTAPEVEPVPVAAPPVIAEARTAPEKTTPFFKRKPVLVIALILFLTGAGVGIKYWFYARSHESTDDAFIDGHIVQISPKASGYVARLYVDDNQFVKIGDLLVELDARDYEARLDQARAALQAALARQTEAQTNVSLTRATTAASVLQARATVRRARASVDSLRAGAASSKSRVAQAVSAVSTAEANLEQARAQVLAAEAESVRANADVERYQALYAKDEIAKQQMDQAVATAHTANAQLEATRQRVLAATAQVGEAQSAHSAAADASLQAQAQVGGGQASVDEALGQLARADTAPQQVAVTQAQSLTAGATTEELRAAVHQAELDLSYTKIYATETGYVTRKSVEQGALVQIGQALLSIVPTNVWVTANFKENQIGSMAPGQPVDITVDSYPGMVFKGHVDSIQAGTGARFSLIPPENATGNYVKVVQRVPVKIVFDEPPNEKHLLAPGMSVVPEVSIR